MSCLISLSSPARTEEGSWDEHAEGRQYCALGAGPAPWGEGGEEGVGIMKDLCPQISENQSATQLTSHYALTATLPHS